MARTLNRLSSRTVTTLKKPGIYGDGAGLYLRVKHETARSWFFVWHINGRRREIGLGGAPYVSLAIARERAQEMRDLVARKKDPVLERRTERHVPTFGEAADHFIEQRAGSVKSQKSIDRWRRMIGANGHAKRLRTMKVSEIMTADVVAVLTPYWIKRPSSAGLMRGYIEAVLDRAKVNGHRSGDNPAAWDGHLQLLMPARRGMTRGHHTAMPFSEVPALMANLAGQTNVCVRALEFTILTAARTSETLLATWDEVDLEAAVWTVPAARMKAGKEHRVPLAPAATAILKRQQLLRSDLVFPGRSGKKELSNMAMHMTLRRIGTDATVHGFRSSFRDWAGETTDVPREVAEAALAHTIGNAAELAYRRGDALEKRRALMEQWAAFCNSELAR